MVICNKNLALNLISENPYFKKTRLYASFAQRPLGFVDVGASGGILPAVMPIASLTHCICFEPEEAGYLELSKRYADPAPFAKVTVFNTALSKSASEKNIYLTKSAVNTSLLKPCKELISRYKLRGFELKDIIKIKTQSLDDIIYRRREPPPAQAEFIKMDCQGTEYDILSGAEKTLKEKCAVLFLELEFWRVYEGQKVFSEIDLYLHKRGFRLYGLYPHYFSTKRLERRRHETEERITWADALYFKEPRDFWKAKKESCKRKTQVLLLVAMATGFYDFALEILDNYYHKSGKEYYYLKKTILSLADFRQKLMVEDWLKLTARMKEEPAKAYILIKKFIDRNKGNNDVDLIAL